MGENFSKMMNVFFFASFELMIGWKGWCPKKAWLGEFRMIDAGFGCSWECHGTRWWRMLKPGCGLFVGRVSCGNIFLWRNGKIPQRMVTPC